MSNTDAPTGGDTSNHDHVQKARKAVSNFTQNTSRAIGSFLPTEALQRLTTPKYTMPDKTVASQVLMYRQLLHTKARPGLKLSRPYQGTAAQKAVIHMPWWEQGIEESKQMVISYDNLIVRLWLNGAVMPYEDLLGSSTSGTGMDTLIDEKGLPPVPHAWWVERMGFQQEDPVTDFRSSGVLGLGMLVYMVECCPDIVGRFRSGGDAEVLPFGITCINITDMMAKFLMLSKSVDKMDALLSQKPFWKMFGDPNAILALQEIAMSMLCDVVVKIKRERQIPGHDNENENRHGERDGNVTVFDFPQVLETTERRVRDDLLGAGPKTVDELRSVASKLKLKYEAQLASKEQRAGQPPPPQIRDVAGQMMGNAGNAAVGVYSKIKSASPNLKQSLSAKLKSVTGVDDGASVDERPSSAVDETVSAPDLLTANPSPDKLAIETKHAGSGPSDEGVLVSHSDAEAYVTSGVGHFSIDDEDEDL